MPKPDAVESNLVAWIREQHQDTVVAWMRVVTASVVNPTGGGRSVTPSNVTDLVEECGRVPGDAHGRLLGSVGAWVLSPTTFRVVRLSGWKERVKQTAFETPRSNLGSLRYRDQRAHGNDLRALILELNDGGFLWETTHLARGKKPGRFAPYVERFLAAYGPDATPI